MSILTQMTKVFRRSPKPLHSQKVWREAIAYLWLSGYTVRQENEEDQTISFTRPGGAITIVLTSGGDKRDVQSPVENKSAPGRVEPVAQYVRRKKAEQRLDLPVACTMAELGLALLFLEQDGYKIMVAPRTVGPRRPGRYSSVYHICRKDDGSMVYLSPTCHSGDQIRMGDRDGNVTHSSSMHDYVQEKEAAAARGPGRRQGVLS